MTDSTYAAAPFDHAKADLILRSSDNVDFRVFKLLLSLASPTFESLFASPQLTEISGVHETKDDLVVIRVPQKSKILDILLRFCYPCTLTEEPTFESLEDVRDALEAAREYSIGVVERKVLQALSDPKFIAAEPVRCFAIALRARAHEETLLAAKYSLAHPLIPQWFEESALISASDLLALLSYHQSCGSAVYALRCDMSWIESHYENRQNCAWLSGQCFNAQRRKDNDCPCPRSRTPKYSLFGMQSLQWWEDFMEETFLELQDKPTRATVESYATKTVQSVKARKCPACSVTISEGMRDFSELLTRQVDRIASETKLSLF